MIGHSHIALLGRRGHHSGPVLLWMLWIKGIGLLAIMYLLIVGQMMGQHFQNKAENFNRQLIALIPQDGTECEQGRLKKAEDAAWDDTGSFNVARKLARWNRDYLAEIHKCEPPESKP